MRVFSTIAIPSFLMLLGKEDRGSSLRERGVDPMRTLRECLGERGSFLFHLTKFPQEHRRTEVSWGFQDGQEERGERERENKEIEKWSFGYANREDLPRLQFAHSRTRRDCSWLEDVYVGGYWSRKTEQGADREILSNVPPPRISS